MSNVMELVLLGVDIVLFDKGTDKEKQMMKLTFWNPEREETVETWASPERMQSAGFSTDMIANLDKVKHVKVEIGASSLGRKASIQTITEA